MDIKVTTLAKCGYCDFVNYEHLVEEHLKNEHLSEINKSKPVPETLEEGLNFDGDLDESNLNASNHIWTEEEIILLLSLYKQYKSKFVGKKFTNKSIWQKISDEISKNDFSVTWEQCDNKFKNLKKSYKRVLINNTKTGKGKISCKYFDLLDDILKDDNLVPPIIETITISRDADSPIPSTSSASSPRSECNERIETKSRKRRRSFSDEPSWFKAFRKDAERRHQERMQMQERMLSIMEKLLDTD